MDFIDPYIAPLDIISIGISMLCGFSIGFERQIFGKPAGIRTSMLICMGAYCFVALSASLLNETTDASRVVGQIVTGIGFLGAGIMFNNGELVQGVTSAAVIWIIASIGCLIGFKNYGAAIAITSITLFILLGISFLEKKFSSLKTGNHKQ